MEKMNVEQFVEAFPFFRNSPQIVIEDILSKSHHAFTNRDTLIQLEGQPCTHLEFILSGEKRVYKASPSAREITLYEVGPGEVCILSAACVLSDTLCPVNATAISDVDSLMILANDFRNLISTYEEMRAFVFDLFTQRLVTILELLGEITFEKMDERLFNFLVEKSENSTLQMTHQQIANDLGTAREVVSRLLKDFERKGKLVLSRGHIRLIPPYYND
jgi:CRP/FNR family transcriptional regulator